MVDYDDITHTLLIEKIKIQYDSNSQWNKFFKYSLRNPHSFVYPERTHFAENADFDYFSSALQTKGYKLNNVSLLNVSCMEETDGERYLLEVEKQEEKNLGKDEDLLNRKIVSLFKECMYYFMSFNDKDGQILDKPSRHLHKKDIKDSSEYELFKSLSDCIVQLHDSKVLMHQALIMTSDFCGLFTPTYVKLTKYSDGFLNFLKENNIKYMDLFYEEMQRNEFYKKKKEHYDYLKNTSFVPLTKGEISLANKKKKPEKVLPISGAEIFGKNDYHEDTLQGQSPDEGNAQGGGDASPRGAILMKEDQANMKKTNKRKIRETTDEERTSSCIYMGSVVKGEEEYDLTSNQLRSNGDSQKKKKKKRKEEDRKKKKVKKKKKMDIEQGTTAAEEQQLELVLYDNGDICNYLNISNEDRELSRVGQTDKFNTGENQNESKNDYKNNYKCENQRKSPNHHDIKKNAKIFHMLNKKVASDEYIYNEIKGDFMKEINLPNNYNYDVNAVEICKNDVKNFYRCVLRHISKKKEKLKIYYIISNFLFFFSKMYKNTISFHDNVHKDINRNFDYKSLVIQGNMLPHNFFLLIKALHLMSLHDLIKNFYLSVEYDERKNKCLHFLNITENKFYENFKKFENNIKANFFHVYKFLHNMIPIHKFLIAKGKVYINSEKTTFSFKNNELLQLTYNNPTYDNKGALVVYEENNDDEGRASQWGEVTNKEDSLHNSSGISNPHNAFHYFLYDSTNTLSMNRRSTNVKNVYTIIDDKEMHKVLNELADLNDNYTKNLIKEKRLLFILDSYEKNSLFQNVLFSAPFFDTYISLIFIFYINSYVKKYEPFIHIPLFKPSYLNMLAGFIKRKKREVEMKERRAQGTQHTVDRMCNNFFRSSLNSILSNRDEEIIVVDGTPMVGEASTGEATVVLQKDVSNVGVSSPTETPLNKQELSVEEDRLYTAQINENNIIVNERMGRKNERIDVLTCIFVLINANHNAPTEEEKKIREITLHVLKAKEMDYANQKTKYAFKYRNKISDAITLSEIEIRKGEFSKIFIFGIVLSNDISGSTLQEDIHCLYSLQSTLRCKYPTRKFELQAQVFTFYWVYEVHVYGSIFLNGRQQAHALSIVGQNYLLPYQVQWKSHPLWGYYLYIIQDNIDSKYSQHSICTLRNDHGINVRLCSEEFDVQIIETDIKEVLHMHNLELEDLKYINRNIFLNIIFLIENGHLTYFNFHNTENIQINQKNNYLCIKLFKSKVTFPSFKLNTPLLNDSWLSDVLESEHPLPFDSYFYKF
ncbi:translation initiation factor EIF-2B subunit, putative [Plasmodium knowlesi strain H]|uniref:Translation initiation factor EIF-2B subunit, putative n=3 Tax=Plasmodium knowlesi TaxID=5850 RepID=A0A5K1V6M5_PLAKH|nr:conserved Plasmodium protein, unknown function [Plasmodium knowlesi strain H]OTN65720.1 putative Translation initiation factor EIF-2B subunit [Plasmodium knowlesi]CAA9989391.1 conserved Plasmodium protein, unknown function [Plasmodium knowlesi strain H]SBO24985.1 translation initiation factor EIF-2B subunit, putative [Plasmodium knowlesi strain H]SBO27881.1 translation initiation factor EIF-2B subunit, putative [Plasmodium knowlesi strain H]VVS78865.1 conserved Plasmodium protein, unknown f|eukprot:XP_002260118.1 hypothetical protein, conserved in Plasmodium species [Plasmodium knowlesi strain H]